MLLTGKRFIGNNGTEQGYYAGIILRGRLIERRRPLWAAAGSNFKKRYTRHVPV